MIFYPNMITPLFTDLQVLDRQTGEIFVIRPIYTNTAAGVTAGDEIFLKNYFANNNRIELALVA